VPQPGVSVVIPAYNAAQYLPAALESVVAQTFSDYEVIVVNDGSPDTHALEAALAPYRSRVTYLTQPNTGPSGARNLAIRHSRGTYIAFLDSDDEWMPEFLARQIELAHTSDAALVYCDGVIVGGTTDGRRLMEMAPSHPEVTLERLISEECVVLTSCTVARRDTLLEAGLFDERFRRAEDAHLWLRLARDGARMLWQPAPLVRHRVRPDSLSADVGAMLQAYVDVLEDLEKRLAFSPSQRSLIQRQIARRRSWMAREQGRSLFLARRYAEAAAAFYTAGQLEPARSAQLRLQMLHAGLRLAPRLLRRAYGFIRSAA
jgi:glycosyltransferase involved in cell wall biosynthesis